MYNPSGFSGGCDALRGHFYDYTGIKQAGRYQNTTKAVKEYIGSTYTYGGDIRQTIESMTLYQCPNPLDPSAAYSDIVVTDDTVTKTAAQQVTYMEGKIFD